MENFTVKETSWHYRLIKFVFFAGPVYSEKHDWDKVVFKERLPTDFCSYWRAFTKALLVLGFYTLMALTAFAIPVLLIIAIIMSMIVEPLATGAVGALILLCVGTAALFIKGKSMSKKYAKHLSTTEPGMIRVKYRSWKDKYCPSIEYKDK